MLNPIDMSKVKTYSIKDRKSKVSLDDFIKDFSPVLPFKEFLHVLPNQLAAKDLKEIVLELVRACKKGSAIILAMGAHPIKVGLNPLIIKLMERGILTGLALNGAGIIHDFEIAYKGETSEDVDEALPGGQFGLARETGELLNIAISEGYKKGLGLGEAVGYFIENKRLPYAQKSLLASGYRFGVPVTVHVAIGTDIIHIHPKMDPEATGACTHLDFRKFSTLISGLEKGVYINMGSAVIMPEIFLKALSLVRNLGYKVEEFTTVNLDFKLQYRPLANVVRRPTLKGGKGYNLIGHHEIMFPLLVYSLLGLLED